MRRNLPCYIRANIGATKDFEVARVGNMQAPFTMLDLFDQTYRGPGLGCFRNADRGGRYTPALNWEMPFLKAPPAATQTVP